MHRWGYAPTLEVLAEELFGGSVVPSHLLASIRNSDSMSTSDGFVSLAGKEDLVTKSKARVATHRVQNGTAVSIAREFANELVAFCPVVDCVALSGSVASGGYSRGDDIDFDVFAKEGTKYLVYAFSLALGLKTTLKRLRSYGARKLVCINVIWTSAEWRPFQRQDEGLGFELLHCRPLIGADCFRGVVRANPWLERYFPQVGRKLQVDEPRPEPNAIGRLVLWTWRHPRILKMVQKGCRCVTRTAYETAHLLKRRNRIAVARFRFLQRVKYPYEFFQD